MTRATKTLEAYYAGTLDPETTAKVDVILGGPLERKAIPTSKATSKTTDLAEIEAMLTRVLAKAGEQQKQAAFSARIAAAFQKAFERGPAMARVTEQAQEQRELEAARIWMDGLDPLELMLLQSAAQLDAENEERESHTEASERQRANYYESCQQ